MLALSDEATPNTDGIGAEIIVSTASGEQRRWVTAGSSSMFAAEPTAVHFGLGDDAVVDAVTVIWPDGERTELGALPVNQRTTLIRHTLEDPS